MYRPQKLDKNLTIRGRFFIVKNKHQPLYEWMMLIFTFVTSV